jgi:hypothetical protein
MISKGTTHNNGVRLANYMTTGKPGERAELWQLRGFEATNIRDAFRDVQIMAKATKCQQPFLHVQVRNRDGEELSRQQWEHAADRIEKILGLSGQPRAIAFHTFDNGDSHMHVAFSRIQEDTLKAIPLPFFKQRLKKLSRELELEFALEPVPDRRMDGIKFAPTRAEQEQARRLGVDIHEIRATIRSCYERSDCGLSFQAALEQEGLTLAQGERRDFLLVDQAGGFHALGKRVLDVPASKVRDRLSDLSREDLPTVEMVRASLREKDSKPHRKKNVPELIWDRDRADQQRIDAIIDASIAKEKSRQRAELSPRPLHVLNFPEKPVPMNRQGEFSERTPAILEGFNRPQLTIVPRLNPAGAVGKGSARAIGKTLDAIGGAVESLFAPITTPEQRRESAVAQRQGEAERERALNLAQIADEMARQREEAERRQDRERGGGGRER